MKDAATSSPPAPPHRGRKWGLLVGVGLILALWAGYHWGMPPKAEAEKPTTAPGAAAGPKAVPVLTATVRRGDLPVYLAGLGTVTAANTVTVRSRLDGQLLEVHFTEDQIVHQGDLLALVDPRPYEVQLTQAQGQLARDTALLQNARLDLQRFREAGDAVSQQQLDAGLAQVAQYEGVVQIDRGLVDSANLNLTYCRITAPLSGRIGFRLVDQGNMVHANDAAGLAVITQMQPIMVVFSLPQDDLPQIQTARREDGELKVEAYGRDLDVSKPPLARGRLTAVDNAIDPTTGTAKFKAEFTNEDGVLFPNQFVNVRLRVGTKKSALLIPVAALQRSPQGLFVYLVNQEQKVEKLDVELVTTQGDTAAIAGDRLKPGDMVVTDGMDKLQPGAAVMARSETAAHEHSSPGAPPAQAAGPAASAPAPAAKNHP